MRKVFQILGIIFLIVSLYVAGYSIWRGPAMQEKCERPYYVDLPNGFVAMFFRPLIEIDRSINEFTTEITLID